MIVRDDSGTGSDRLTRVKDPCRWLVWYSSWKAVDGGWSE